MYGSVPYVWDFKVEPGKQKKVWFKLFKSDLGAHSAYVAIHSE